MLYVAGHEHAGVVVSLNCEFCSVLKEKREKRKREKRKEKKRKEKREKRKREKRKEKREKRKEKREKASAVSTLWYIHVSRVDHEFRSNFSHCRK